MSENPQIDRIERVSRHLKAVCTATLVGLPILIVVLWLTLDLESLGHQVPAVYAYGPLTPTERAVAIALTVAPLSVALFAVWNLRRLFSLYATGRIFTRENVRCFRNMGWALIVIVPVEVVYRAALSVALSMDNPPGERFFAIELSSNNLGILLIGAVVLVVSWVMAEAVRVQEENAQIV